MKPYIIIFILYLFQAFEIQAQNISDEFLLENHWNSHFSSSEEILKLYRICKTNIVEESETQLTQNDCYFIGACGKYVYEYSEKADDISSLLAELPVVSLSDTVVLQFMAQHDAAGFVDSYYMLQAMKRGDSFDESRDGLSVSTHFPIRKPNRNDFQKLSDVLNSHSSGLHDIFMQRLQFVFRNNGCMPEMLPLRPLIERNIADSPLKRNVLALYEQYEPLMKDRPAPSVILKDISGKEHSFTEFIGKVLVVDIWASWCCSCLEKMSKFKQLKKKFENENKVAFLTVSIDRKKNRNAWLAAIDKHSMQDLQNWVTDTDTMSDFEMAYRIEGIPRYLIINPVGQLVTAYAPSPDNGMEQLIIETLKTAGK